MKYRLPAMLFLIMLIRGTFPAYGDASLGAGTDVTADLTTPIIIPALWLDGHFSGYHPFSPVLALTYDGAGDITYDINNTLIRGSGLGDIHLSWLLEKVRIRTGITGLFTAGNLSPGYSWSVTADAEAGYDTFQMSLSALPSLTFRGLEGQAVTGFDAGIELEGVIAASPTVLLTSIVTGGGSRSVYDDAEYRAGVKAGITWYSPKSVIFNGSVRWLRQGSEYREELVAGEPAVPADSYHLFEAAVQTDLSFSRRIRGSFGLPIRLYLKDHSAVSFGSYLNQNEIDVTLSPDFNIWFDFTGSFTLESGLGGVFVFSNSPANRYSELTIKAGFRYHF